jgi:hypothetical protein
MSPTFDEVEKLQIEMMRILEDLPTHEPYHKLKVVSNAEYPQN